MMEVVRRVIGGVKNSIEAHGGGYNSLASSISRNVRFRRIAYVSSILLSLLVLFTLCPLYLVPEVTDATTKDANPSTLTFSFVDNKDTASVSLSVTDQAGNFASSTESQKASFSLSTNNATGYTLNLRTDSATTTLSDGTHSINTISSSAGITADNFTVNTYGILPSKYNSTDNTGTNPNYYPASSTGFTMNETSCANNTTSCPNTSDTYTIGLGLKANYATVAGTYTTATTDNGNTGASLVLEYVANAVTYSINYYTNTSDTVTNMPSVNPQTGAVAQGTTSTSVNLASAPTRTGYTFKGWCLGTNASTSNITIKTDGTADICNSTAYDAGQSFGIDATKSPDTYYLFAMWQRNSYTCTKQYRLQNADGTWGSYTADGTESVLYGATCSYSKTVTNYKGSSSASNGATGSTSGTMGTSGLTLSLDFYRNTFTCKIGYKLQNADGTYGSVTNAVNATKRYGETCSWSRSADTTYKAASYANNSITANVDTTVSVDRNTFTVTKQYRLQDTSGNYPSSYTSDGTATVLYGASYTYSRSATTTHQAKSQTVSSVTSAQTISLDVPRVLVTCNRQYRLENADGSWGSYTTDGSVNAYYGGSCSYSKSVTDYKGSSSGTNGSAGSASASNVTSTQTLSVSLYRNTYTLTVSAGSNTSSATGGGTKRWGQTSTVSVTKASNVTCTSYATPTWTQSGTTGTFSSTSGTSVNFTMGKGNATVTASSTASNISQTVTLSKTNATGITIGGTSYTGTSASLTCGTYNISGSFASGYEFSSWAASGSVSLGSSTTTASNSITVSGTGTLTLTGKSSATTFAQAYAAAGKTQTSGYYKMQDMTGSICSSVTDGQSATLRDTRNGGTNYTVAKIGSKCWMTQNLMLGSSSTIALTSADSNVGSSGYTLPKRGTYGTSDSGQYVWGNDTQCTSSSTTACAGYYSYATATAGTNPSSGAAGSDICPANWRLPTRAEFNTLIGTYTTGATLTQAPFLGVYAGYYNNSSFSNGGSRGYYWSSYALSSSSAYSLLFSSSASVRSGDKYCGRSVRCVAKS